VRGTRARRSERESQATARPGDASRRGGVETRTSAATDDRRTVWKRLRLWPGAAAVLTAWALVNVAAAWGHFVAGRTTSSAYWAGVIAVTVGAGIGMWRWGGAR